MSRNLNFANTFAQIAAARNATANKQMTNSNPNLNVGNNKMAGKSIGGIGVSGKYYRARSLSQNLQQIFQGFHYHEQLSQEMQKQKEKYQIQNPGPYVESPITPQNSPDQASVSIPLNGSSKSSPSTGSPEKDALQTALESNPLLNSLAFARQPHNPHAPLIKSQSFHVSKIKGYDLTANRNPDVYPMRSISFDQSQLNRPKLNLRMSGGGQTLPYPRSSNLMSIENTISENYDLIRENSPSLGDKLDVYSKRPQDFFNFDYTVPDLRYNLQENYLPSKLSEYPSTPRLPYLTRSNNYSQSLENIYRASKQKKQREKSKEIFLKDRYPYLDTPIIGGSCDNLLHLSGKVLKENPYLDNYSTFHGVTKAHKGRIPFPNLYKKKPHHYFYDDRDNDLGNDSDVSSSFSESDRSDSSNSSLHSLGAGKRYYTAPHTLSSIAELHRRNKKPLIKRRNSTKSTISSPAHQRQYSPASSPIQSRSSTPVSPSLGISHPLITSFPPENNRKYYDHSSIQNRSNRYKAPSVNIFTTTANTYVVPSHTNNNNSGHSPSTPPTTSSIITSSWNFLTSWQNKTLVRKLFCYK